MSASPYAGHPESQWAAITSQLVDRHPLTLDAIVEVAVTAWKTLWKTTVGAGKTAVKLRDLRVPATVVGYFFEILFSRELERRAPDFWRGGRTKEEKDVVCLVDPGLSIEIKTSGQCGFKVYGNRSYRQELKDETLVKKEKSGYYITVNFFGRSISLLRFGWIDAEDWDPQEVPTGQMAGLKAAVYKHKLVEIRGSYRQQGPVLLLSGVGEKMNAEFQRLGIRTIGDLLKFKPQLPARLAPIKGRNRVFLEGCTDESVHE